MKKLKQKRLPKLLTVATLSTFSIISMLGIMLTNINNDSSNNLSLTNKTNVSTNLDSDQSNEIINESVTIPKVNDTNGKTLVIGKNVVRLNNKVVYIPSDNNNPLASVSLLTVYDEEFNRIQEIQLDAEYDQMTPIDFNDVSKGIIISSWNKSKALYFRINIETQTIIEEDTWAKYEYNVPINAYHVGGNFDLDGNGLRTPVIISVSIGKTETNIDKLNLLITSLENKSTKVVEIPKQVQGIAFNEIKLIDCISASDKLYIGINLLNDGKVVGSNLILLKDGEIVSGGPTFDIPYEIKSMTNDNNGKKVYVQYRDVNDNSIRLWNFNTSNPDNFGQISGGTNKASFSQMVVVNKVVLSESNYNSYTGIITLGDDKSDINYYDIDNLSYPKFKYSCSLFSAISDKISDIVYNKYTEKFNLFYSYNCYVDGVISWNFDPTDTNSNISDINLYTDIAPVHIRYADYIQQTRTNDWINEFASVYAKNEAKNDYNSFLEIPTYFKELQKESILKQDNSFEIKTTSNDNIGTFNLIVNQNKKVKTLNQEGTFVEKILTNNLLDFNVSNFINVNPDDIKASIDTSSPLLTYTPTKLEQLLNDPATKDWVQDAVFKLFGIDEKYQKLDYIIKINGYNVLGNIDIQITFPTVYNYSQETIQSRTTNLVNKTNIIGQSNKVLQNNFNAQIEEWFIPTVTISALLLLVLILLLVWFVWGKNAYENYLIKYKKELLEEYEPLKILTDDKDINLEKENGEIFNPMCLASTIQINMNSDLPVNFIEESHFFKKNKFK